MYGQEIFFKLFQCSEGNAHKKGGYEEKQHKTTFKSQNILETDKSFPNLPSYSI
jgi:hypothetical protein